MSAEIHITYSDGSKATVPESAVTGKPLNIGIMGHVDAGKTSELVERLAREIADSAKRFASTSEPSRDNESTKQPAPLKHFRW